MDEEQLSLDEFSALAKSVRVQIDAEDLPTMRYGYLALQKMLNRMSRPLDPQFEPAVVFVPRCDGDQ